MVFRIPFLLALGIFALVMGQSLEARQVCSNVCSDTTGRCSVRCVEVSDGSSSSIGSSTTNATSQGSVAPPPVNCPSGTTFVSTDSGSGCQQTGPAQPDTSTQPTNTLAVQCQINGSTLEYATQQECDSAKKAFSCQETCEGLNDGGLCYRGCVGENPCPDGQHIENPMTGSNDWGSGATRCVADDTADKGSDSSPVAKCEQALKDVSDTCKLDNNSDIQQIMQVSKQFSSGMANNAVTACTDIGKLASSANMAMFGFESKCQAEFRDCTNACNPNSSENKGLSSADKATLRSNQNQCKKYSEQVKPSELDAQRAMQSQVTNSCDNLLAKLGMDCLRNPSGPGCSSLKINPSDCKNPANISNQVCLCINNPAACSNLSKGLANLPSANGGIEGDGGGLGMGGGIGAGLPGGALSLGDDMIGLEGKGGFSGVNTGAGGGRGGGGYGGGDAAGGGRGKPGLAMKTGPETNIYKGNYGGGAAFGGPGGSGGGAGYRDQNGQAVPKGSVVDKNGRIRPDFSKFYPNMKYDPGRGLAGVSGPDGITGPATNLFNKVNNQFRSQAKTFLP